MAEPMRRLHQGWSGADCRVSQSNAIGCPAIPDLLLEISGREKPGARRAPGVEIDRIDLNRPCDIFEVLSPQLAIPEIELPIDLIQNLARDGNATAIGDAFEACGDVDTVAIDIALVDNDVTEIDADAHLDPTAFGKVG